MTELKEIRRTEEEGYEYIMLHILHNEAMVGEVSVMISESGAYCERIDIDKEHRNQGIGTEALKLLSRKLGSVTVAPDNEDAQRLYERIGYDVTGKGDNWSVDQGYGVYEI